MVLRLLEGARNTSQYLVSAGPTKTGKGVRHGLLTSMRAPTLLIRRGFRPQVLQIVRLGNYPSPRVAAITMIQTNRGDLVNRDGFFTTHDLVGHVTNNMNVYQAIVATNEQANNRRRNGNGEGGNFRRKCEGEKEKGRGRVQCYSVHTTGSQNEVTSAGTSLPSCSIRDALPSQYVETVEQLSTDKVQ